MGSAPSAISAEPPSVSTPWKAVPRTVIALIIVSRLDGQDSIAGVDGADEGWVSALVAGGVSHVRILPRGTRTVFGLDAGDI